MKKIFLGGTCNGATKPRQGWRGTIYNLLSDEFDLFDPVVEDWTDECIENENKAKKESDILLFHITPAMKGVYSIAEVIEACWNAKESGQQVVFSIQTETEFPHHAVFDEAEIKSMRAVGKLVENNFQFYVEGNNANKLGAVLDQFR